MKNDVTTLTDSVEMLKQLQQGVAQGEHVGDSLIMGFSMTGIMASLIFSIIGLTLFRFGKKNGPLSSMIYGILLMVYPYFVTDTTNIIVIGVILSVLPFVLRFG